MSNYRITFRRYRSDDAHLLDPSTEETFRLTAIGQILAEFRPLPLARLSVRCEPGETDEYFVVANCEWAGAQDSLRSALQSIYDGGDAAGFFEIEMAP